MLFGVFGRFLTALNSVSPFLILFNSLNLAIFPLVYLFEFLSSIIIYFIFLSILPLPIFLSHPLFLSLWAGMKPGETDDDDVR